MLMRRLSRPTALRMRPPMMLSSTQQTQTLQTPVQTPLETTLQRHLKKTKRKLKGPRTRTSRHLTSRPTPVTTATMQRKKEGRMPKTLARRRMRKLQMKREMLELQTRRMLKLQTRRQRRRNRRPRQMQPRLRRGAGPISSCITVPPHSYSREFRQ